MVRVFCDKCGRDSDLVAYDILVRVIHNPVPHSIFDTSDPKMTTDNDKMRMVLCQKCYSKLGFPNIYKVQRTKKLEFRDCESDDHD